ncbi:MAG TPA: hypothetical protein VGS07_00285 [Thermoanaerobaculia bacterium]|jgi:hypothetical protein|nr:hypothetical protein [Thermoanaerobaculia bacterium]
MIDQDIDMPWVSSILESISKKYPSESDEQKALRLAGQALLFVFSEQVQQRFRRWRESMQGGLSDKQKEHLRSMGIDSETGEPLW